MGRTVSRSRYSIKRFRDSNVVLFVLTKDPISPGRLLGWLTTLVCSMHLAVLIWQGAAAEHVVWAGLPEIMLAAAVIGLGLTLRSKRILAALFAGHHPRWVLSETCEYNLGRVIRARAPGRYRDAVEPAFAGVAPLVPVGRHDWAVGVAGLVAALVLVFVS